MKGSNPGSMSTQLKLIKACFKWVDIKPCVNRPSRVPMTDSLFYYSMPGSFNYVLVAFLLWEAMTLYWRRVCVCVWVHNILVWNAAGYVKKKSPPPSRVFEWLWFGDGGSPMIMMIAYAFPGYVSCVLQCLSNEVYRVTENLQNRTSVSRKALSSHSRFDFFHNVILITY